MAGELGFPFEVGGPSLVSVTVLGRSPSVITKRIPRSSGLPPAPPPWSREKLVHQVRQVFCDLDKVVQGLPGSLGLWIRSPAHLQFGRAFGRLGPLDRDLWDSGRWGPMGKHVS
jgi:hypothetical protein